MRELHKLLKRPSLKKSCVRYLNKFENFEKQQQRKQANKPSRFIY